MPEGMLLGSACYDSVAPRSIIIALLCLIEFILCDPDQVIFRGWERLGKLCSRPMVSVLIVLFTRQIAHGSVKSHELKQVVIV